MPSVSNTFTPCLPDFTYLIVGTGFSGLGMAISLEQSGERDFCILEQADVVGGTWRENTYPGCACDVPSHLYSFSFAQNPNWSRSFSPWHEIKDYLIRITGDFGVFDRIRFNTKATEFHYDESNKLWSVHLASGEQLTTRFLIIGTGPLTSPLIPKFPGIEDFQGAVMHSGQWNHEISLENKNVVIIGTGASTIQIAPAIAGSVKKLHIIQRTPPWIFPRKDRAIASWQKKLFRTFPFIQTIYRGLIFANNEVRGLGLTRRPKLLGIAKRLALKHIQKSIPDPELRAQVTPDYTIGCKRALLSDDYYPTLSRDNVSLQLHGIDRILPDGLMLDNGQQIDTDVIVYGTGFHGNKPLVGLEVFGKNGRSLQEEWNTENGAEGFYGTCVSGYPNLFTLMGPNTGLGHNSVVIMIELQIRLIRRLLEFRRQHHAESVEVKDDIQSAFNKRIRNELSSTVWQAGGCHSWYQLSNGKNVALWPGLTIDFKREINRVSDDDFIFTSSTP